jgi:hypothetical protein
VQDLFSGAYGQSLEPVFNLFLRTTDKLEVRLRQLEEDLYEIRLANAGMTLPLDVQTDSGLVRTMVPGDGIRVRSKIQPTVDPHVFYLKKVISE